MEPTGRVVRLVDMGEATNMTVQVPGPTPAEVTVLGAPSTAANPVSFDESYAARAGRVGRALELTLQNRALAEDALNEAMTRALTRWNEVGHYANPEGWVYRTGLNWARSWLRRRRLERNRRLHDRPVSVGVMVEPGLADALASLSVDHRAVVICRFHLDLSTGQTAEALAIAEGTVKSRLSRALDQIRNELGVPEADRDNQSRTTQGEERR